MQFTPEELAQLNYSAHIWINMLHARESRLLEEIYGQVKQNNFKLSAKLVEFTVIRDQISQLKSALNRTNPIKE